MATDEDRDDLVSYRLEPPQTDIIVNEHSGDLSTKPLDREAKEPYYIQLVAFDNGMRSICTFDKKAFFFIDKILAYVIVGLGWGCMLRS